MTGEFWLLTLLSALYFAGTGVLNALMPIFVVDEIGGTEATDERGAAAVALCFL